ncbi:MAG TPA: hypothetical protein VHB98_03100 [Chloroflexota bacterium]|nr:hypothetical protein [Chloroflexota bacterium]
MIGGYFLAFVHPAAGIVFVLALAVSHSIEIAILGALLMVLLTYCGALVVWHRNTSN